MMRGIKRLTSLLLGAIMILQMLPVLPVYAEEVAENAPQSKVIVSLGDSYSAGEGITPFYGQSEALEDKVKNEDWLAHRSEKSWPGQLTLPAVDGDMAENRDTNWYFVATSGAETKHMNGRFKKSYKKVLSSNLLGKEYITGSKDIPAQLKVFDELNGQSVDYVTITLGGNDAGFVDVITDAVVSSLTFNPSGLTDKINGVWREFYKEGGIRDNLRKTYEDIAQKAGPQAKIIVAGYPKLLEQNGKGALFSKDAAKIVNEAVSRFNSEIEALVNSCKASGMKICFVSVEDEFDGHEAYAKDAYINKVMFGSESEDIEDGSLTSAYSIHPNEDGAKAYARCVQEKIDQIEKDGGKTEWPTMVSSDERDVVLVLDVSGSMKGDPIEETKIASEKFVDTVLKADASIGIVTYDNSAMTISDFCMNKKYLKNNISNMNSGGGTDIEDGMKKAQEMLQRSHAKKKIIVLMSDGEPTEGKDGNALIEYANTIKEEGVYIYTLGFFGSLSNKTQAQALMEGMASDGCHYEVDKAENIVYFFDDIADQIQGTKYQYIRIACPVDVTVKSGGEVLSSKDAEGTQRTSFGTMTFEESEKEAEDSEDNRIKVLRLKEGKKYNIRIEGNGVGQMNYTIGFMDDMGQYSDLREFSDIEINEKTKITTVAEKASTTVLKVDEDGDGEYEYTYEAGKNGTGKLVEEFNWGYVVVGIIVVAVILIFIYIKSKKRPQGMNFCYNCGAPKESDATFCPKCGAKFNES